MTLANVEIYGVAFNPPSIVYSIVSPKKHIPILLINPSPTQVREDVNFFIKNKSDNRTPVVLAGGLDVAQTFVKQYPDLKAKLVIFDYPSLLVPFSGEVIRWLDCDHQAGGAWQIAKIKPEDFNELLDKLKPLSEKGCDFVSSMFRFAPKDRVNEIEAFANNLPKHYKQLLAAINETDKSPLKIMKEGRKSKDNLRTLIQDSLESIESADLRKKLVNLVLEYQLSMVAKREFLNRLVSLTKDESTKKDFLNIRKWVDSKSGFALRDAYFDLLFNKDRRSWQTILETQKKVHEEDLLMLISYLTIDGEPLPQFKDKLESFVSLPSDKQVPKVPYHPVTTKLDELFNY